jgi:hypothetical protein
VVGGKLDQVGVSPEKLRRVLLKETMAGDFNGTHLQIIPLASNTRGSKSPEQLGRHQNQAEGKRDRDWQFPRTSFRPIWQIALLTRNLQMPVTRKDAA